MIQSNLDISNSVILRSRLYRTDVSVPATASITVAVCANMDGSDKMQLLVIGKFQNPRCFKNVKSLPMQYFANRKAWMVSEIFKEWLRKLDRKFSREHRKVLMLVDNCPAHPSVSGLKAITLKFLPPNTTSHL